MEELNETLLSKSLSGDDYQSINETLRSKIEAVMDEHMEDFLTAKALFESTRSSQTKKIEDLTEKLTAVEQERDNLKVKLEALTVQCDETTSRLSQATAELNTLRETVSKCEKACEGLRQERDEAVDERQVASSMLERRNTEIDRLTSDVSVLTDQLRAAVAAKCEALATADEVSSKQIELELKEKRMESERALWTQQNVDLTVDLAKSAEEMTKQRRESSGTILSLQTKLAEKDEEIRIGKEQNAKILSSNNDLTKQLDHLTEKLKEQCESENKLVENFQQEVRAQAKLVEHYKSTADEAEAKSNELTGAVRELQRLLQEASSQYGELETKLAQLEENHSNDLKVRDESITVLKEELKHANALLDAVKQESSEEAISRLSPLAASTSKLLKSGLTLTQIYTQYAQVTQELLVEKQETSRLKEYINRILEEIEEKAPMLQKQRQDYDYAITTAESLTIKVDELEKEHCKLRRSASEAENTVAFLTRENKRLSGSLTDLSRQVCFLLKELEAARGNMIPMHDPHDRTRADIKTSSDLISKHLVTFHDIEDLQMNNQKLLAALRELSAQREEAEIEKDSEKITTLKGELKRFEAKVSDLQDREKILQKEVDLIKSQRDIYARLFKQHIKPGSVPVDIDESGILRQNILDMAPEKVEPSPLQETPVKEAQPKKDVHKVALEELKKEFDTYRNERNTNEKMLNETINKLREDLNKAIVTRSELSARATYNEEKSKTLQANAKTLTSRVEALESQCKNYRATIAKHEESLQNLRQEAMKAMSNLSVNEVALANLKQENQLLRDSERRLINERDAERKQKHGQEMLMANLEALKAKFECSNAEARMRLESRLDDANKECAALRRRLQEEQDRLTRRMELSEQQTVTAKERLEEEKTLRVHLNEELESARELIKQKEAQVDSMSTQLSSAISNSQPVVERDNRIKELEQQMKEKEAEVNALKEQLAVAKKNCTELSDICQGVEKQLAEITNEFEKHKQESETTIAELKKTESELRSSLFQLEMKLKMSTAAEAELTAQKDGELASLRSRVENLGGQVQESKERCVQLEKEAQASAQEAQQAQAKCSEQMTACSQLQQELDTVRNELSEARSKIEALELEQSSLLETSKTEKEALLSKADSLQAQLKTYDEKVAEVSKLNDILQDQLQELGVKVSVIDSPGTSGSNQSVISDSFRESDKLLEVLRYMRKEKTTALAQCEAIRGEKLRLEADVEVLRRQLDETRKALEDERNNKDVPSIIAERHTKLLHKVEMLNELSESNRSLLEERDRLTQRLSAQEEEARRIEAEVISPARQRTNELSSRVEQLTTENTALKAESARWQQRANQLIERSNKTSPEDLKRLTQEKENLTKQLNQEKEQHKLAKVKLEEQIVALRREKQEAKDENANLENSLGTTKAELEAAKEEGSKASEKATKLAQDLANQEAALADTRSKEIQIRQIAKKYKSQYQELSRTVEEERKAREEAGTSVSPDTEKKLHESDEKIKQLTDQVTTIQGEVETLRRENDGLKNSVVEREERAKQLLKNARARIKQLTEENKVLAKELTDLRGRPKGSDTRISSLESRISRLEKEKTEEQTEKERLAREVEVQNQRLAILQRQLDKQQGSKPSTSSTEKSTNEPPTANIKPLAAGSSSSATKQQQTQHSATVTPWRDLGTPFASIRPMSQQTRTVVVLPTSQTTSTSNQPVLVAPQQQVVHTSSTCEGLSSSPTSSHMDYIPPSSTAVHNIHQATVILGQHMEAEVNTEESAQPPQHCVPPSQNVSIALVLPQPPTQSPTLQDQQQVSQPVTPLAEAASAENTGVVSASNQEQVSEQSVSASNHPQPPVVPAYYRQVEESGQSVASSQAESGQLVASSQQQAASSSTSVTTTQAGSSNKRPNAEEDPEAKIIPPTKRSRLVVSGGAEGEMLLRSDGLEVEYQVPTSSQRDQEDDILVISDDEDIPDEGAMEDGQEFEEEGEEESRYGMEAYSQNGQDMAMTSYEEGEGPDIDDGSTSDQDNNEVDINDDSNEVPNQCESSRGGSVGVEAGSGGGPSAGTGSGPSVPGASGSSVAGGSGAASGGGGEPTSSHPTSLSLNTTQQQYPRRSSAVPLLNRHHMMISYEDPGDDSIVPSTPTLFVPRRTDGFGEAVSSPHVPSARFIFSDPNPTTPTRNVVIAGVAQVASEGMDDTRMDLSQLEEGTGRSVPSTPSHVSPQETSTGSEVGQSSGQECANNSTQGTSAETSVPSASGSGALTQHDTPESRVADDLSAAPCLTLPIPQQEPADILPEDNVDGVSSEGEKPPVVEAEEEGREAEATEGGSSSSGGSGGAGGSTSGSGATAGPAPVSLQRGATPMARRSARMMPRTGPRSRAAPIPIVWHQEPQVTMTPLRGVARNRTMTRAVMGNDVQRGSSNFRGVRQRRSRPFHNAPFPGQPRF